MLKFNSHNSHEMVSILYGIVNKSQYNFYTKVSIKFTRLSVSLRGQKLWSDILGEKESIQSYFFFQNRIKSKLLQTGNETKYFENFLSF